MKFRNLGPSEDIASNIRSQLDGYRDGLALFKEMIQNADDAGANVLKICYDKRNSSGSKWNKSLFTDSPKLSEAQGRAIWFYNDASFNESDFENIAKLGGETKKDSPEKIGKFGRGFCSVYNLTDLPSILSGDSLAMFDPNIDALRKLIKESSNPGVRVNLNERVDLNEYHDQLKPYDGIFACDIFRKNFNFEGTLIRLPFRTSASKLSDNIYHDDSEIIKLFEFLHQNAHSILLFTQSVKEVEAFILEDEEMKLLFLFKVSPINFFRPHSFGSIDSLKDQSSMLKASIEARKRGEQVETSIIVKVSLEINLNNLRRYLNSAKEQKSESHWILNSSFYSKHLRNGEKGFENFLPCVGTAVKIEPDGSGGFCWTEVEGSAFCFLPLNIDSGLKYHVNCAFALSSDRLRIIEKTREERRESLKSLWNNALVEPLVDNLIFTIRNVCQQINLNDPLKLVRAFWPLNCSTEFFERFEESFYERICSKDYEAAMFPMVHPRNKKLDLFKYEQCFFVDFSFESSALNEFSCETMKKIAKNSLIIIRLPDEYLKKLRRIVVDEAKFIDDFKFLSKLLANKDKVEAEDLAKLIVAFVVEKCFDSKDQLTKCGEFIRSNKSVPNRRFELSLPSNLVNPLSSPHFASLDFAELDEILPAKQIANNDKCFAVLQKLGLMSHRFSDEVVLKIAGSINSIAGKSLEKAKEVSESLLIYLYKNKQFHNLKMLEEVRWVSSKEMPSDWCFEWRGSNKKDKPSQNKFYKPSELSSERHERLVGCVRPILDSRFGLDLCDDPSIHNLVTWSIEQLRLISESSTANSPQVEGFFHSFYALLLKFVSDINEAEFEQRINHLKKSLPEKWIYERDSRQFLSIKKFAFDVKNQIEPEMLKFPQVYLQDSKMRNLFTRLGVEPFFSFESLLSKLIELKAKFSSEPVDSKTIHVCQSLVLELIHVSESALDTSSTLPELKRNPRGFFLPDESGIMRNVKNLCIGKLNARFSSKTEIFSLHSSIYGAEKFGIESANIVFSRLIGRPFAQKEKLTSRIKGILQNYSNEICVFTEFIQNADDAEAKEIRFVLDRRQLSTDSTFAPSFNPLQGPALCCWSDSIFTENDLESIKSLGVSYKNEHESTKIGRFGLGFNTAYHFTDAPQFITNFEQYIIFDPLCKYYPQLSCEEPGQMISDAENMLTVFPDVLTGFDFFPLKNATMFRLALRRDFDKTTFLSQECHEAEDVKRLMTEFMKKSKETLIFLKNIRSISFYELIRKNGEDVLICLKKENLKVENELDAVNRIAFYQEFKETLKNNKLSFTQINFSRIEYTVTIEDEQENTTIEKKCEKFYVIEQFGFGDNLNDQDLNKINGVQQSNRFYKFFPIAGIAFSLSDSHTEYQFYSFLPLQQRSPIDCHVNGFWALQYDNRKSLFNSTTPDNICTKWNQILIDFIILPLYVESLNKRIEVFKTKLKPNNFPDLIKAHFEYFPRKIQTDHSIKLYFEFFNKSFYQQISYIHSVPVFEQNTKQVKWLRPNELVFSKPLLDFADQLKPKEVQKSTCEIVSQEILPKMQLKICDYNNLLEVFNDSGEVNLSCVNAPIIIKAFKNNSHKLSGICVDNSVLKNSENLLFVLKFCLSQIKEEKCAPNELNECPMLLDNNKNIVKFNETFYLDKEFLDFFQNSKLKFLNENFHDEYEAIEKLVKKLSIDELERVCESLVPELKVSDEIMEVKDEEKDTLVKKLSLTWSIISKILFDKDSNNVEFFLRRKQIIKEELNRVIKDWNLIPVCIQNSKGSTFLSKIHNFTRTIAKISQQSLLFEVVENLKIPFLDQNLLPDKNKANDLIKVLAMSEEKAGEILMLLHEQRSSQEINNKDARNIRLYFNNNIKRINDEKFSFVHSEQNHFILNDETAKEKLRDLPIFEDLIGRVSPVGSRKVFLISANLKQSNLFPSCGNEEFCSANNFILLNKEVDFHNLFTYLNFESIDLEKFYSIFFKYHLNNKSVKAEIFVSHIQFIQVLFSDVIIKISKENKEFWQVLRQVPFIQIEQKFYSCGELYDPENELFQVGFPDLLIPNEFRDEKWSALIEQIGYRKIVDEEDFVKLAFKFESVFAEGKMEVSESLELAKKLLSTVDKKTLKTRIERISDAKFIPSFHQIDSSKTKLKEKIIEKAFFDQKFVSLKESAPFKMEKFCWVLSPVVPAFFDDYLVEKKAQSHLVENFLKILEILTEEFLGSLESRDSEFELPNLFHIYYKEFTALLKDKYLSKNLEKLRNVKFILNNNKWSSNFQLSSPEKVLKKVEKSDVIEGFIQSVGSFDSYWDLFKNFGAKEELTLEDFRLVLEGIRSELKGNDDCLGDSRFDDVLTIYKCLLEDAFFSSNCAKAEFWAPNLLRKMRPLNKMHFIDNPAFEALIKSDDSLKEFFIFDLNQLTKKFSREKEINDAEFLKNEILKKLSSWNQVVHKVPYFVKNPKEAPKPASELIDFKLSNENLISQDFNITYKIHSEEFVDAIFSYLKSFNLVSNNEHKIVINQLLNTIVVFSTNTEIDGVYMNKITNKEIKQNYKNKLFFLKMKSNDQVKLIYSKKGDRNIEDSFFTFLLAESIVEEIKREFSTVKFNENRLIFMLSKIIEPKNSVWIKKCLLYLS